MAYVRQPDVCDIFLPRRAQGGHEIVGGFDVDLFVRLAIDQ